MQRWWLGAGIALACATVMVMGRQARWAAALGPLVERTAAAGAAPDVSVDARLLVVSVDGHDGALHALTGELDTTGIPYTVVAAADLATTSLSDAPSHGLWSGVIVADCSGPNLPGPAAPAPLVSYLGDFKVRAACLNAPPDPSLGFGAAATVDTRAAPLTLTYTPAGAGVFGWYASAAPVTVAGVGAAVAPPDDASLDPLLVDDAGHAAVAVKTFPDGHEVMLLTFDQAPGAAHSRQLLPGVASWVSRGVYVGEKRAVFGPQVDDIFIGTVLHDGTTFRLGGDDLRNAARWQDQAAAAPAGGSLALTMPFNGVEVRDDDALTQAAREVGQRFQWVSHTFDHHRLDAADYARMTAELTQNDDVMTKYMFGPYDRDSLVTPDVSGLSNAQVMKAAADWGIQQVVCDASYAGCNPPVPNTALTDPVLSALLLIPRVPTDLYANVAVPDDWVQMWNALNAAAVGRTLSYDEILDRESDRLLDHLLAGDMAPWMFHQANLRAYDGTHTLLTDLLDKLLDKYRAARVLPLVTWPMSEVAARMRARTALPSSGLVATVGPDHTITLRSTQAIRVAVTGARANGAETYGDVTISTVDVPAGGQVTIPLAAGGGSNGGAGQVQAGGGAQTATGCGCGLVSSSAAKDAALSTVVILLAATIGLGRALRRRSRGP